ncbi:putative exported protein [Chlamydia psittaci 06-1683]|nr:putative exported protein [Chlamydia psittaci 06-1683]
MSVWEYPEKVDVSRPELNLQEGFAGMLQALPESQVLFMQAKEIQGHKALEFWISCEDIYFRGMLISVNHTLYQVFMVYKNKNSKALDKEYETFTKSFKITKVREARNLDLKKKVRL